MAFFGSKSYERAIKRTYSTDRFRREREHGHDGATRSNSVSLAQVQAQAPSHTGRTKSAIPSADEFGVLSSNSSTKDDPPSLTFSTTSASASLPPGPATPIASPSLSVPVSVNGRSTSLSSSPSSAHKQPSSRARTMSGTGSKHSSGSSKPARRRTPQLEVDGSSSSDATRTRPNSGSSGNKKSDAIARARSSVELKIERSSPKSRSKTSLRAQAASDRASETSASIPARPPRSLPPPDAPSQSSPALSTFGVVSPNQNNNDKPPATRCASSSSSSPHLLTPNTNAPVRQRSFPSPPVMPRPAATSGAARQNDSSLSVPPKSISNPNSVSHKPSCGNASDSSYGTHFSDFGAGFSVKRLLSKPAASSTSALGKTGVRSEPDTSADSYDSYSSFGLTPRRRRVEGRSNMPEAPRTMYSVAETSTRQSRKPTSSDPEPPRIALGSLGRARGLEWGHVLDRERETERFKTHTREGSSFSLSSPSEGIAGYPHGLPLGRAHEQRAKSPRPFIQLTTSAVRRLSALGVREEDRGYERDRSRSPGTPMTFGQAPSPTPSPLTSSSARARSGLVAGQPSPTTSSSVVRRSESPMPPVGLTPAEIVAHAYKEQERRRTELELEAARETEVPQKTPSPANSNESEWERAQWNKKDVDRGSKILLRRASANVVSSPISLTHTGSHKGDGIPAIGEPATPYYTVIGEPTGRVYAIGSARDSAFNLFDRAHEKRAKEMEKAVVAELSGVATATAVPSTPLASLSDPTVNVSSAEEKPVASHAIRRKLSRKVSAKARRDGGSARAVGKESGKDSSSTSDGRNGNGTSDPGELLPLVSTNDDWFGLGLEGYQRAARPSLTLNTSPNANRRSATLPREKSAVSVKMSLDSFVAVQSTESSSSGVIPSAVNGALNSLSVSGKAHLKEEKDRGKLWGLMKRISSNALKDKYKRTSGEMTPPVPALPRDVSSLHTSPTFDDEKGRPGLRTVEEDVPLRGRDAYAINLGTPPSRSPSRRPSTAPTLGVGEAAKEGRFGILRKKASIGQLQLHAHVLGTAPALNTGPSVLTRSSSPFSDMALSHRPSDGSPSTSNGDSTLINSGVGSTKFSLVQHILPPETLCKFDDFNLSFDERKEDDARSKLDSRDTKSPIPDDYDSLFYGEEPTSHQALPVPPRRPHQAKPEAEGDDFRPDSPTIPSFSADNAINAFGQRKRAGTSMDGGFTSGFTGGDFGTGNPSPPTQSSASSVKTTSEPPPRPPRSARRVASTTLQSSQSSRSSPSPSPSPARVVLEDREGRGSISAHSQASTARPSALRASVCSTPSPPPELLDSHSPVSASDSASSTMTFRDIAGMAAKPVWTEKEKVDKWNDLLDRSERAGGTLHVGLGGSLLSDQLRESAYEPTFSVF